MSSQCLSYPERFNIIILFPISSIIVPAETAPPTPDQPKVIYRCGFETLEIDNCNLTRMGGPANGLLSGNFTPTDDTGPEADFGARGTRK